MRVALKIAYEGRAFYGHQRQPDVRTVEGECIAALRSAKVIANAADAWFRSASRTDRGVSALGNVIAFDTRLPGAAALGAFNGKARGVWAWAYAAVHEGFHPRHAEERWYRYHILTPLPLDALRAAASLFPGKHEFRWFTSDPPAGPFTIGAVEVSVASSVTIVDVRARSFRRGMVRRVVAALAGHALGEVSLEEIRGALQGERHDFGMVPAEPLVLMDVRYNVPFTILLKPKVLDEWARWYGELTLQSRFLRDLLVASGADSRGIGGSLDGARPRETDRGRGFSAKG